MFAIGAVIFWSLLTMAGDSSAGRQTPERRALDYLAREVPKWSVENKCYSCHNNGDAARALYAAIRLGEKIPDSSLSATTAWLRQPEGWDHNGGDGPYSDKKLARLQFAAALTEAVDAGTVKDREPLKRAAEYVASSQEQDGSWHVDAAGGIGSPATHGTSLATYLARRTLAKADADRFRSHIARADEWLRKSPVNTVLDAGAILLASANDSSAGAAEQRRRCLEVIRRSQAANGGWGPYSSSPPEAFDTAIVVLALVEQSDSKELQPLIQRGRAFLIGLQKDDGSWPETTRPSGGASYAQRLSTAGWATLALLATRQ